MNPYLRRPPSLTDADRAIWAAHEAANARAADQYEALPITHRNASRVSKCTRCRNDIPAYGLCRNCRRTP